MARKKISLREFQESLVQRLTSARAGQTSRALLGVQAGRDHWLLDLSDSVSYTHLRAHETVLDLVCRLLL